MGRIPTIVTYNFLGTRRRAISAWMAEEARFLKIIPPVIVLKIVCFTNPLLKKKETRYLYPVDNEVVDDLRRITRAYAKNIGGLPIISIACI